MAYVKQEWKDEVLNGAERYNITAPGTNIDGATITLATSVTQAGTPLTAERMNHIENGIPNVEVVPWTNLPLSNGWGQHLTWGIVKIGRWGNVVSVRGIAGKNGSTSRDIAIVPVAFRPKYHSTGVAVHGSGRMAPVLINSNGQISFPGSGVLDDYYYLNLVWII